MLQQGLWPKRRQDTVDPDAPLQTSHYRQGSSAVTMPSEAFQYEIVYDAFRADKEFWQHWKVVDCARNSPEQSISHGSATLRVVLDLPATQRLFPTAYTPGFPTLPFGATAPDDWVVEPTTITWVHKDTMPIDAGEDMYCDEAYIQTLEDMQIWCQEVPDCVGFGYDPLSSRWKPKKMGTGFDPKTDAWEPATLMGVGWRFCYIKERAEAKRGRGVKCIPGLPPGYSVALEVHLLEEARIMLAHQRSFRGGKIDPSFEWLDAIVKRIDGDGAKPEPRAKKASRPKILAHSSDGGARPEADLRPAVGSLPLDSSEPGMSEAVKTYSDLYGDTAQVTKHVGLGKKQVYGENTLISAFGGDVRLPKPESGSWAGPVQKSFAERQQDEREGLELDRGLEALLSRTAEGRGGKSGGGLIGSRLDR